MGKAKWYKSTTFFYCLVATVVLLAFVNAFYNLTDGGIYDWDEARHGVNAYEMQQNNNYIVQTYDGNVDYYNVKPPLSMWFIAAAYKLFGTNIFALRFFSALCLPVSVAAVMMFLGRCIGRVAAVGTGLLLAVTGTRFHHLFKTGDPDALFFLFCMLACIFLYLAVQEKQRYLIGCGLCMAAAFLTKSFHAAPLVMVVATTLLMTRKQKVIAVKDILFYLIVPMAVPVLVWAALRLAFDGTEFFKQMVLLDLFNRVALVAESHGGTVSYYFVVLKNLMGSWIFWGVLFLFAANLFLGAIWGKSFPSDKVFLTVFIGMLAFPLVIFTIAKTKLGWYAYSCLIGFFVLAGYCMQRLVQFCANKESRAVSRFALVVAVALFVPGLVIIPFENIHQLASPSSADSVFAQFQASSTYAGDSYFVINTQGRQAGISQSWLLHAQFQGLHHVHGDIDAYLQNPQMALLVVRYESEEELEQFLQAHQDLTITAQTEEYVLLA